MSRWLALGFFVGVAASAASTASEPPETNRTRAISGPTNLNTGAGADTNRVLLPAPTWNTQKLFAEAEKM